MAAIQEPLKFAVFNSKIELPFYSAFFDAKLNHDKLDESVRPLLGLYESSPTPGASSLLQVHATALTSTQAPPGFARAEGRLKNFNTLDAFKNVDKRAIIAGLGQEIWDAINDGTIYSSPSLLASYFVISFADLKKYRFMYWFGFPALHSEPQWKRAGPVGHLTSAESTALVDSIGTWKYTTDGREHGFFLAKKIHGVEGDHNPFDDPSLNIGYKWVIGRLGDFETGFFDRVAPEDQFISFLDPSTYPDSPGWPLRNLLVLIRQRYRLGKVQILCFRDVQPRRHEARSIILPLEMTAVENMEMKTIPKVTGWERNASGNLAAKITLLTEYLDPTRLANQAVDLNLKLMKWRIAPTLDLDVIKRTKCLLLGAGTLGGYVARNLMGWGVRHITFVDNGAVSFSNPVRQPLFTFDNCLNGGAPKALRSASALKEIFPGVQAAGHVISIPMLGHPILPDAEAKTKSDFLTLQKLIDEHDAIFILMDTRESRWLPTLMGKAHDKIVLNAALGFDSYVVMRHGAKPADSEKKTLGCYFCNDIVAPGDSIKDLTLDQQCTVTRPGISTIASALLVEMFTSILQHEEKHFAPAPKASPKSAISYERDPPDHPLGLVPHQIRGFLGSFQNMILRGENYPHCSACSDPVLDAYREGTWEFVKKALNDKDYIPEISGLAEVHRQAEKMLNEDGNFEDDGDDDGMEDEGELL